MALPESAVNYALANVLNRMRATWQVAAELTGQLQENKALQIDVLVMSPGRSTIVIENEYLPARSVGADALSRLGKTLVDDGSTVTQVVELRTPAVLKDCQTTEEAESLIQTVEFEYALLESRLLPAEDSSQPQTERIPPESGKYLRGSVMSFANFLANVGLSTLILNESLRALDDGVQESINILKGIAKADSSLRRQLADLLMQAFSDEDISQGLGVAVTVIINATLFQQRLSAHYPEVSNLFQMRAKGLLNQAGLLEQWQAICEINYWPIFSIAISVMEAIDNPYIAERFIERIFKTTQRLIELNIVETHDLCGVIFQRFMTERKYLASFFTRPESACLLAHLAVPNRDWHVEDVYKNFRFADFACGTGALVHGVYQRIAHLCEFKGGDAVKYHAHMMEKNITAADIVPSAAHLTATLLSSLYPEQTYATSRVVVPQYGLVEGGEVALGSLELLDQDQSFSTLFPNPSDAKIMGPKTASSLSYELLIDPESQDLVIMNPPYTRAMSDWIEDAHGSWKPFKALGNTPDTQQRMRNREKDLTRNVDCYNGYQSMPSAFCGVADRMLKKGGIFAFVLPTTALQGVSWHGFRRMLTEKYTDVIVVSIAGRNAAGCAWSADTNLAEVLVVARKKNTQGLQSALATNGILVNLKTKPPNNILAAEYAARIRSIIERENMRSIKDGPRRGTPIEVGGKSVGELVSVSLSAEPWRDIGIRETSIAQFAHQLGEGHVWFPRSKRKLQEELPIRSIKQFSVVGFADNNIANNQASAFQRIEIGDVPDFPMVWRNDSASQTSMLLRPDQEGRIKPNRDDLAFRIWDRRSRSLIAREVSYSSQSLIAGYATESVIGGRGWPNVQLQNEQQEKAFVLWGNCSLGAILFWYYSSRQQVRRSIVTVTSIADLPWLDPTQLSEQQLIQAEQIFDEVCKEPMLPFNQMTRDEVRRSLDQRLLIDVLGLPHSSLKSLARLRKKWCAEPAIS